MGSFSIIGFFWLLVLTGLFSIVSNLILSVGVDMVNILILAETLSQQTVDTVNTILVIGQWSPVIALLGVAVWAISSQLNNPGGQ